MEKNLHSDFESLWVGNDNVLIVSWMRAYRLAYSSSVDRSHWTKATAPITLNGYSLDPSRHFLLQLSDGRWLLAYNNDDQEIWVSMRQSLF